MVILSLFDGMSCGRIALERSGIKVTKYFAAEINKFAMKVSNHNWPDIIQVGDVTKIKFKDGILYTEHNNYELENIDLVIGGSPCQGFSQAGDGLAFDDSRSKLFFEFHRIVLEIKKYNPKMLFLLENVKMKKLHEAVITKYMGVNPIEINSSLVSAQNRERIYWTNINQIPKGFFGDLYTDIPQPKDKGIILKHILQPTNEVLEKYYLSEKMLRYFANRADNFNQGKVNIRSEDGNASALLASSSSIDLSDNFIKITTSLKRAQNQNKAGCLTGSSGNSGGLHSDMDLIIVGGRITGRNPDNPKSRKAGLPTEQMLELREDEKTNCLSTVQKDSIVLISDGEFCESIRRFTPIECERLQTVPDNYTSVASDTQRYKMLGNGWTVDVIVHILSFISF